jgi:hypothetical protein
MTLKNLMDEVKAMKNDFSKKFSVIENLTVVPFILNVVAQILLFLIGCQSLIPPPTSNRFHQMTELEEQRVRKRASKIEYIGYRNIKTSAKWRRRFCRTEIAASTQELLML